jgi:RNA polymerase sigma-70 factor (ECF subfamily)
VNSPEDEKLLLDYAAGDAASFELLVRRHAGELYQFATRFTGSSALAEDVVQETLLKVHQSARSFNPVRRFRPWLYTIAANSARDVLRRQGRKREVPLDALVDDRAENSERFNELFSTKSDAPFDVLSVAERRRWVRRIVAEMPERLREILILAYYHQFPYKDIGEILDIPIGTVKSRLHLAIGYFGEQYRAAMERQAKQAE